MILPLLVLGRASVNLMSSGRARLPISLATHFFNSSLRAARASGVVAAALCAASRLTKATMA